MKLEHPTLEINTLMFVMLGKCCEWKAIAYVNMNSLMISMASKNKLVEVERID
jgi:hypothetical protein